MGTVYKKGDTWYIRFDAPRGFDGKRKQVAKACTGMTKRQAEQHLRELESAIVRGDYQAPSQQTLGQFLEEWLTHARSGIAASTFSNYRLAVRIHITPALGSIRLDKLTPLDIQKFYTRLGEAGSNRNSTDKPLAPKTIKNIHLVLHKALAQAIRWGMRANNPADGVELPRQQHSETKAISVDELQTFISAVQTAKRWRIPLLIAIGTGMRRGEILALQWQDFDPEKRLLVVRRALSHITTKEVEVSSTKTGKVRVVALDETLTRILEEHRAATPFNRPSDWICTSDDGSHLLPHGFTNYCGALMKKLGMKITLHGLRHTHATALIAAGVPVKVISERLGHSSVVITQDIYGHVLPTMQRQAADIMETLWPVDNAAEANDLDCVREFVCTYCAPEAFAPKQNALPAVA